MKTVPTKLNVLEFLENVENEKRKQDALQMLKLMQEWTGFPAVMWGSSIIGFGSYHYKYESGREGDFMLTGFSPRKSSLTLYIMSGFKKDLELMNKLGTYKTGKSCLYIKKLEDIDLSILKELVIRSVTHTVNYYK
ncbi:DUF1801 domain-containing protein [Bacteroidota bacterium]